MTAKERSLREIMQGDKRFQIPFFQRQYVWNKENWEELLDNLLSDGHGHFLGSIILKPAKHSLDGIVWTVIDGQQRLTTLSVLFKVCHEVICAHDLTPEERAYYDNPLTDILYAVTKSGKDLKLHHSRADAGAFNKIMLKAATEMMSCQIQKCYEFFTKWFGSDAMCGAEKAERIFEILSGSEKLLVAIELEEDENEQIIFDTINSAGVRLTSADTIKNYLFQRLMSLVLDETVVKKLYDETWDRAFAKTAEASEYWLSEKRQGRITRTAQENMLQCFAVVKGIYDPNKHSVVDLVKCFKEYAEKLDKEGLRELILELTRHALLYRKFFRTLDATTWYRFDDVCLRTLHILRLCDTTTFDPLILHLISIDPPKDDGTISEALAVHLNEIASFVLRHVVCHASVKNFNKDCAVIIHGGKTLGEYREEKIKALNIDDNSVRRHLQEIYSNKIATGILFWLELKRRKECPHEMKEEQYTKTLEHLMPQTWKECWNVGHPCVVDPETGERVLDNDRAMELRKAAIYEIGNMALLSKSLNSSIKNGAMKTKIEGDGGKHHGIKEYATMLYTKDVINRMIATDYVWNEGTIRERTVKITDAFLKIW